MSELTFDHVSVRFGSRMRGLTAVDAVDLTIPAGQVVGLVGESGSGKSTLARAAVGLTPVSAGRIELDGQPIRHSRRGGRRPLQMVFQDPASSLDPRMTIGESVAEAIPKGFGGKAARRAETVRLLELVELAADSAERYPVQMSGGQRQRAALARAIAGQPDVIIADEITSALDVSIQGTVLNLVRDLQRRLNFSMLFISHNLAVVRYVSDMIAVMYLGQIVEHGPVDDVLHDPQHPYTKELLAAAPQPGGHTDMLSEDPALAEIDSAEPADPHHPPSGCRFHPRCPIGPLVQADRDICRDSEPTGEGHIHQAACHFAARITEASQPRPEEMSR
jgi:peptide/nickel transport system ATP-binding protein